MLRKAVGQDAAFEEGVKLVFDERRHVGADSVFCLGEVSGSALRLNRTECPVPICAIRCRASNGCLCAGPIGSFGAAS